MRKLFAFMLVGSLFVFFAGTCQAEPTIKPFGFTHLWWQYSDNDDFEVTKNLKRARLGALGNLTPDMNYMVLSEWGDGTYFHPFTLLDAWVNYKIDPAFNIKVGQTWYKFTLTGTGTLPKLPLINRAQAINSIWTNMGRKGSYAYDKGVELWGNMKCHGKPCGYFLFVTGGTGLDNFDDNGKLDYCLRVFKSPTECLQIGASGFMGSSRVDLTSSLGSIVEKDVAENAMGVDISYKKNKLRLICEYLQANYESSSELEAGQTYTIAEQKLMGMYFTAGYMVMDAVEAVARYDMYDPDADQSESSIHTLTLGITCSLKGNALNDLKVNYTTCSVDDNYGAKPADVVAVQMQLAF
ncbi:MAG: porin [Elusimicrobiota bacterium]